ncbi:hypothetical protein SERLA73DRAFT_183992 [Serpula lacrymans var. lacrymans S7.3]|uniref:F-box domain-containing protein n=1 Tax=Serpula lacrymans var. lacrymans (strain S7.3) TaxID=936435 RepID=F8Q2A3_SERL3|nr:hypothetical protein SERLA73DRAFT_183992 [Serpula lacrymans var. lacrymans S7.3]
MSRPLSIIPNEIYLEIFDNILPLDYVTKSDYYNTLSRMAVVCRFFASVALPRIFGSITFSPLEASNCSRMSKLSRQIIEGVEPGASIALYVKECFIEHFLADIEPDFFRSAFLSLSSKAMARMSNIVSLTIHQTPIQDQLLSSISDLVNLKSLVFTECHISAMQLTTLSLPRLTNFELTMCSYTDTDGFAKRIACPALNVLKADILFASELPTSFYRHVKELHLSSNPEDTSTNPSSPSIAITQILSHCASLTHLTLMSFASVTPIWDISLDIPVTLGILPPPSLHSVEFRPCKSIKKVDTVIRVLRLCSGNAQLSESLRRLSLVFDIHYQRDHIIPSVCQGMPNVSCIRLDKIEWRREAESGVWRPGIARLLPCPEYNRNFNNCMVHSLVCLGVPHWPNLAE